MVSNSFFWRVKEILKIIEIREKVDQFLVNSFLLLLEEIQKVESFK